MQTVRCTSDTTCFVLDTKNLERLVGKKNNPQTMDIMREYVKSKLHTRMQMRHSDLIPLLGYLHQKLTEQSLPPAKKVLYFFQYLFGDMWKGCFSILTYYIEKASWIPAFLKHICPTVCYRCVSQYVSRVSH